VDVGSTFWVRLPVRRQEDKKEGWQDDKNKIFLSPCRPVFLLAVFLVVFFDQFSF
jgi:hypothetical protein